MRRHLPAIATIIGVAVALPLAYGSFYLNYDAIYALLWAQDITLGRAPDYTGFIAPTPHPLATAVSVPATLFGAYSDDLIVALTLLSFGGLVWLTYRLGETLFTRPVGVLAAAVVLTRPAFHKNALVAYQDIPFVMLVVWAVLLEARRPRRGLPVLALLGMAGLLRPEAWVLSGLYVLYMAPAVGWGARLRLATIAAVAPLLWALSDLAVTGDLLHSLHGTSGLAEQLNRPRSIGDAPYRTALFFGFTLREPLMIGVPIGLAFAWLHCRRRAVLPFAVAVLMTVLFMASTVAGLPLIARYVLAPSVLLALFYALGVFGYRMLEHDSVARRRWRIIGACALALSIVYIPFQVGLFRDLDERTDTRRAMQEDLRTFAFAPDARRYLTRCGRLSTTDHRTVPYLRYWLKWRPGAVQTHADPAHPLAEMIVIPISEEVARRFYDRAPDITPPTGYRPAYHSVYWRLYVSPACDVKA